MGARLGGGAQLRLSSVVFGVVFAASAGLFGPAQAVTPTDRFSIMGGMGLAGLKMGDVNDQIDRGNVFAAHQNWISLDRINQGFNFDWEVRGTMSGPIALSLGGGAISGKSGVDFDQVIDIKAKSSVYRARVDYLLPWSPRNIRLFAAGGPIYLQNARTEISHEARTVDGGVLRIDSATLKGSSVGAEILGMAELVFNEHVTLVINAGYRYAKATADKVEWKVSRVADPVLDRDEDDIPDGFELGSESYLRHAFLNGDRVNPTSDGEIKLDFSGPQANFGLRFYLF